MILYYHKYNTILLFCKNKSPKSRKKLVATSCVTLILSFYNVMYQQPKDDYKHKTSDSKIIIDIDTSNTSIDTKSSNKNTPTIKTESNLFISLSVTDEIIQPLNINKPKSHKSSKNILKKSLCTTNKKLHRSKSIDNIYINFLEQEIPLSLLDSDYN